MVSAVKDICIFMIIVQAVLCFTPSSSYEKYIRVLVGILLILRITEPVFGIFLKEETKAEIQNRVMALQEELENQEWQIEVGKQDVGIYSSIEEELKRKIEGCGDGNTVRAVELNGMDFDETPEVSKSGIQITVTVIPQADGEKETARLQELYGNCLGVMPEQIMIEYIDHSRQRGGEHVKR